MNSVWNYNFKYTYLKYNLNIYVTRWCFIFVSKIFYLFLTYLEKPKKENVLNKLFHPSTNSEILVKIVPLDSELLSVESRAVYKNEK